MFWLLVIGLVHAYGLWYGDILNTYAICGAALYPLRRLKPAMLIALGVLLLAVTVGIRASPPIIAAVQGPPAAQREPSRTARIFQESQKTEEAAYRGSYIDLARWRATLNTVWHFDAGWGFSWWRSGGFILLGMGLFRLGVFSGERSAGFYLALAIGAYAAGLMIFAVGFSPQLARVLGRVSELPGDARRAISQVAWPARFTGSVAISLGHVGLVMLVCKAGAARRLLSPVAAAGRMALSNYLMHTVICVLIFDGWGLGQWGRWRMSELALLVGGIWAAQLVLSPLWLRIFRFGPAEWVWRSLTYWRVQPVLARGESLARTGAEKTKKPRMARIDTDEIRA